MINPLRDRLAFLGQGTQNLIPSATIGVNPELTQHVPEPWSSGGLAMRGHQFATLDYLRGVAAFAVCILHFRGELGANLLPHACLAVDFFFVLSGFVLAHAYEQRLLT